MLPGVTTGNYNRVFNVTVMGSNSNETTILTDGVSINNVRSGGSWLLTDFDGAQEVSTTTLGASAEYQAAGGGVMNVVGKTGTNQFRGDAVGVLVARCADEQADVKLPCATCEGGESGFPGTTIATVRAHHRRPDQSRSPVVLHRPDLSRPLRHVARTGAAAAGRAFPRHDHRHQHEGDAEDHRQGDSSSRPTTRSSGARSTPTSRARRGRSRRSSIRRPGIKDDPNLGSQLTAILHPEHRAHRRATA